MSRETVVCELIRAQARGLKMPGLARVFENLARGRPAKRSGPSRTTCRKPSRPSKPRAPSPPSSSVSTTSFLGTTCLALFRREKRKARCRDQPAFDR